MLVCVILVIGEQKTFQSNIAPNSCSDLPFISLDDGMTTTGSSLTSGEKSNKNTESEVVLSSEYHTLRVQNLFAGGIGNVKLL